jgi:hypothetical protein
MVLLTVAISMNNIRIICIYIHAHNIEELSFVPSYSFSLCAYYSGHYHSDHDNCDKCLCYSLRIDNRRRCNKNQKNMKCSGRDLNPGSATRKAAMLDRIVQPEGLRDGYYTTGAVANFSRTFT